MLQEASGNTIMEPSRFSDSSVGEADYSEGGQKGTPLEGRGQDRELCGLWVLIQAGDVEKPFS